MYNKRQTTNCVLVIIIIMQIAVIVTFKHETVFYLSTFQCVRFRLFLVTCFRQLLCYVYNYLACSDRIVSVEAKNTNKYCIDVIIRIFESHFGYSINISNEIFYRYP